VKRILSIAILFSFLACNQQPKSPRTLEDDISIYTAKYKYSKRKGKLKYFHDNCNIGIFSLASQPFLAEYCTKINNENYEYIIHHTQKINSFLKTCLDSTWWHELPGINEETLNIDWYIIYFMNEKHQRNLPKCFELLNYEEQKIILSIIEDN